MERGLSYPININWIISHELKSSSMRHKKVDERVGIIAEPFSFFTVLYILWKSK